jgi:hypothetical protein
MRAAPGRCHERFDGDRTKCFAQREPFGMRFLQMVQKLPGT